MFVQHTNASLKVSCEVSFVIAKQKKVHIIGEDLVLPAAKVTARNVFGNKSVKKLNSISVSNNTVQQRIKKMLEVFRSK